MGRNTKIDWCDATWNPVTGCLHGCEYCYAERIATRFGGLAPDSNCHDLDELNRDTHGNADVYPFGFAPTFHRYRLDEPQKWKRPKNIFVCSMADLFGEWVPDEWIRAVFDACDKAPQHRYLFLTKNPRRMTRMANARLVIEHNEKNPEEPHKRTEEFKNTLPLPRRDNWWWGSTIDSKKATWFQGDWHDHTFLSLEPLRERLDVGLGSFGDCGWIIIGAETGNRKGKVVPEREWVDNITEAAHITRAKVFMKESLRELMIDDFRQEFPWEAEDDA